MNKRLRPYEAPLASLQRLFAALAMVACLLVSPLAATPALAEDQAPTPELIKSFDLDQLSGDLQLWLVTDNGAHAVIETYDKNTKLSSFYAIDTRTGDASLFSQQEDGNFIPAVILSDTSVLVDGDSSQSPYIYDLESGERTDLFGLDAQGFLYRATLSADSSRLSLVTYDSSPDWDSYTYVASVYDLEAQRVTESFSVTGNDLLSCLLSSDGSTLYVLNGDSPYHVLAYDMATGEQKLDQAMDYSADSGIVFFSCALEDGSLVLNAYPEGEGDIQYRFDPGTGELSLVIDGAHDLLAINSSTSRPVYLALVNQDLPADKGSDLTSSENRGDTLLASIDVATGEVLHSAKLPSDFTLPVSGNAFVSQDGRYATMLHQDSDDSPLTLRTYDVSTGASSEVELSGMDFQSVQGVLTNDDREVALLAVDDNGVFTLSTYDTGYGGNGLLSNPLVIVGIVAAIVVAVGSIAGVVVTRRRRRARRSPSAVSAAESTQLRHCPNCGRELANTKARFCPSCGHKINS
ncbi:zinc ribbon domain-containing protein [Thermophilibacter sp.]